MAVYLNAVGLAAPGLLDWSSSQSVLTGQAPYEFVALEKYKPTQLPPNEARRATELVRMAFRVGEDLMRNTSFPMQECASVFSSSGGDYPIIDQICQSLCEPERLVSPTQFHNSVHNSAAGYWSIATGSRLPSTSLSAYDDSFSVGLLEAIHLCQSEQMPTLLVVYDIKPPYPLSEKRIIPMEFGVALLLMPFANEQTIARLSVSVVTNASATVCVSAELEALRHTNPAARSLSLLEVLAGKRFGNVIFENANQNSIVLEVSDCQ
jgi:hypothetical protein